MMEGRTVPLHGGGELTIGGGPLIDGLIHAWVKPDSSRSGSFMIGVRDADRLVDLLRTRTYGEVKAFAGGVRAAWKRWGDDEGAHELATLWFTPWGSDTPDFAARLYGGAIDTLAEALAELIQEDQEASDQRFGRAPVRLGRAA